MIVLSPREVSLIGRTLTGVESVTVSRRARKVIEEWSDAGQFCVMADVPEQRVSVTLRRVITADEAWSPAPGQAGAVSFRVGPSAAAPRGRTVSAAVVVLSVEHEAGAAGGVGQRIEMVAVSSTGAVDPIAQQEGLT